MMKRLAKREQKSGFFVILSVAKDPEARWRLRTVWDPSPSARLGM